MKLCLSPLSFCLATLSLKLPDTCFISQGFFFLFHFFFILTGAILYMMFCIFELELFTGSLVEDAMNTDKSFTILGRFQQCYYWLYVFIQFGDSSVVQEKRLCQRKCNSDLKKQLP